MQILRSCGVVLLLTVTALAQEPVDTAMVAKIRAEALDRGLAVVTATVLYHAAMRDQKMPQ